MRSLRALHYSKNRKPLSKKPINLKRNDYLDALAVAAKSDDQAVARPARDELARALLPTMRRVAQMHSMRTGSDFEDVLQEVSLGFLQSLAKWSPTAGACFFTFTGFWMNAIGKRTGMTHDRHGNEVRAIWRDPAHFISMDAVVARENTGSTSEETLHDELSVAAAHPLDVLERQALRAAVKRAVRKLPQAEREVMRARIYEGKTLQQVGLARGVSRERIRQIEKSARELMIPTLIEVVA